MSVSKIGFLVTVWSFRC